MCKKGDRKQLGMDAFSDRELVRLETIETVLRQQKEHLADPKKSIPDRIVNLRQPFVRPIVREKAGRPVEFWQKPAFSVVNGYTFIDVRNFDNFNEGVTLVAGAEKFYKRHGCWPEAVLADQIYRTRDNHKKAQSA